MIKYVSILTLWLMCAAVASAHNDAHHAATGDGFETVLKSIEQNNLQLQAFAYEQEAEVLAAKSENVLSGPNLEYSPFYQKGYTGVAESELVVSEEFQFPTRYVARHKQTRWQQTVCDQRYLSARREVLLQAQLVVFDLIRINETLQMLRHRLEGSEATLALFEKRMEAGDANILELNKVKIDRMDVLSQVTEAENERLSLLQQLQQLNGGQPIEVSDVAYPVQILDADFGSFMNRALGANADIRAAEALLHTAQQEVRMSRQEWLPNLTVGYRRNTERKEHVDGILVGVSFPVMGSASKARAARQRRLSAELELQHTRQSVESALQARYNELCGLRRVLEHCDVDMMNQTLDLFGKALQHGEISALQYYNEISSIYEKLQSHINVHCQSAKLYAQLYVNEL